MAAVALSAQTLGPGAAAPPSPPLLDSLGGYHRAVTTSSPEAQRYFDQGLRLLFAFSLEEAQLSFEAAARLDPACASCFWGAAMSLGPHINVPGMPDRTLAAHRAIVKALALAPRATAVEQALIAAAAKRSSDPAPTDKAGQAALDQAYAGAMREVTRRFPDDLDAAALYAEALQQAREAVAMLPAEALRAMPGYDGGLELPIWTLVRIGRFADALREPAPPADFSYATAAWHAARGIALAASGKPTDAEPERRAVAAALAAIPADAPQGFNTARSLLAVALPLLDGEMAAARGQLPAAAAKLREAAAAEDALSYDEPSDWYFPLRPRLAALLLAANRAAEAQAVCEEDLRRHPENGWALAVLAESLRRQQRAADAQRAEQRLAKAWATADLKPAAGG